MRVLTAGGGWMNGQQEETGMREERIEQLVREHRRLVDYVVNRTMRRRPVGGMERDDLISWGFLGLMQAARVWDPARGHAFSTLAVKVIERMISRGIRKEGAVEEHAATVSLDALLEDSELADGAPQRHLDQMRDDTDVERALLDAEERLAIAHAVAELTPEQQWVVRQRFYEERTLEEIARETGTSRQAVHLRERTILNTLRRKLATAAA
jgi:RNA polymerase sigma factor (sigma-70 family)